VQSSSQIIITNKPTHNFLQAGCPSCHPTNSVKALKGESVAFHGLAHPNITWGLPTLSLTNKGSRLSREKDFEAHHQPSDASTERHKRTATLTE